MHKPLTETSHDDWFVEHLLQVRTSLYAYIATLLVRRADVEDMYQRVSMAAWRERERFDRSRPFYPWICGIARNHIRQFFREEKKRPSALSPELLDQLAARREALHECLEKLPAKRKQMIRQFYRQAVTVKEFARRLGHSVEAVYKTLQRTRAALNDCVRRSLAER